MKCKSESLTWRGTTSARFKVPAEMEGIRVDKFLSVKMPGFSRSSLQSLLRGGYCRVNGKVVSKSFCLAVSDDVVLSGPSDLSRNDDVFSIDLKFLMRNDDYFVVEKPPGLVVYGKFPSVSSLLASEVSGDFTDPLRPGIVHRLDRDTSGCLIVARNQRTLDYFIGEFKERRVEKHYFALVKGFLPYDEAVVDSPLARSYGDRKKMAVTANSHAKNAVSRFKVLEKFDDCSLLDVEIHTGRTHQIRVHMQALGHPVLGDALYGDARANEFFRKEFGLNRQFLHACSLGFTDQGGKIVSIESPLPEDLKIVLDELRNV